MRKRQYRLIRIGTPVVTVAGLFYASHDSSPVNTQQHELESEYAAVVSQLLNSAIQHKDDLIQVLYGPLGCSPFLSFLLSLAFSSSVFLVRLRTACFRAFCTTSTLLRTSEHNKGILFTPILGFISQRIAIGLSNGLVCLGTTQKAKIGEAGVIRNILRIIEEKVNLLLICYCRFV